MFGNRRPAQWGGEAILPFSYAGTLGRIHYYAGHPLFHALGGSQLDPTICTATAEGVAAAAYCGRVVNEKAGQQPAQAPRPQSSAPRRFVSTCQWYRVKGSR